MWLTNYYHQFQIPGNQYVHTIFNNYKSIIFINQNCAHERPINPECDFSVEPHHQKSTNETLHLHVNRIQLEYNLECLLNDTNHYTYCSFTST